MEQIQLVNAIKKLRPDAEFSFEENDYSTIKWDLLEGNAPTMAEIEQALKELDAEDKIEKDRLATAKAALLVKLGITADEAKLLLG
jgi:hypothetical protein